MELEFSRQIFQQSSNTKFNQNLSSGSRVVPCGRTEREAEGRTDMTKLIVAFRNFANAHKKEKCCSCLHQVTPALDESSPVSFRLFHFDVFRSSVTAHSNSHKYYTVTKNFGGLYTPTSKFFHQHVLIALLNKTGNARITWDWGAFTKLLLQ